MGNIVDEIVHAFERTEMLMTLLYEVVERTGQHREGYYALRSINEHTRFGAIREQATPEDVLQFFQNIGATIETQIKRIERMS